MPPSILTVPLRFSSGPLTCTSALPATSTDPVAPAPSLTIMLPNVQNPPAAVKFALPRLRGERHLTGALEAAVETSRLPLPNSPMQILGAQLAAGHRD